MNFIVTFDDIAGSVKAEGLLKKAKVICRLDTAPRSIGNCCTYIIRTKSESAEALSLMLHGLGVEYLSVIAENI